LYPIHCTQVLECWVSVVVCGNTGYVYTIFCWVENVQIIVIVHPDPKHTQGQSWSIGGDPNAQTVATFLRFYTPNIVGASLGNKTLTNLEVSVYIAW